ncbi:TraR/DksA family transcriptional regulator [Actinomadura craniellae]|uniref:TraR/DksA family transcriptional regulator n=1 Tax=Actinomadura craniellae TaxID=2231787 RepID=A0A365GXT4_9ACTN|nr:TraR/DksA family transcriptional regulator [Actinomadura craniellae]RAY11641.1 TraR/DksA family transcriptional regulator [Actinomadura craniellae]
MPGQIPDHLDHVGRGWHPLLLRLHEELLAVSPGYAVNQVKEKYGTLRVYLVSGLLRGPYLTTGEWPDDRQAAEMGREDDAARRLVAAAEEESGRTCESCGAPGRARQGAWIKTLCDGCHGPCPRAAREGR